MPIPLAAIAAAPQIIQGIGGILGLGKGKRNAKKTTRPVEPVNPLFQKNVAMAENMARTGMPQQQYNNQLNNIQRNQAGALSRFGRNGGGTGSLASIVRAGNDATGNLNSQDAMARVNNQRFAFGQRAQLANEQNRVWDYNNKQRYEENAASNAQQIGSNKQNIMNSLTGLSQIGQLGMMNGGGQGNTYTGGKLSWLDKLMGKKYDTSGSYTGD